MEAGPHGAHSARPSRARVAPETKGSTREGSRSSFSSPTRRPRTPSDAAALRSRLDMARASGRTFSLAVQWPMRAFGVVSLFASAIALAVTLSPLTGLSGLDRLAALLGCSLLAPVGVLAVLHSLLPSNVQLARGVMIALIPVNLGFGLFGFISFLLPYTAASLACARAGARAHATLTVLAHHHSLAVPCWLMAVEAACEGLKVACNFSAALFLARAARVHAAPLAALWRSVGWVMVGFGALNVVPPIAALCGGVPTAADAVRAALFGVLLALGVRTLQPAHRRAVMAWLARRGERLSAAAGVAELIGGRGVAQIEALAVPRFRCVSAEFVALAHLRDNKPDRSLFALTQPAAIGDVDAFVSHSWHDDPDQKYEALTRWAAAFRRVHGRSALLWIDKYCIDQADLDINLTCLPYFLGACHRLVALAGPTYLTRLWCVIELFAFIEMGGDVRHIDLHLLGQEGHDAAAAALLPPPGGGGGASGGGSATSSARASASGGGGSAGGAGGSATPPEYAAAPTEAAAAAAHAHAAETLRSAAAASAPAASATGPAAMAAHIPAAIVPAEVSVPDDEPPSRHQPTPAPLPHGGHLSSGGGGSAAGKAAAGGGAHGAGGAHGGAESGAGGASFGSSGSGGRGGGGSSARKRDAAAGGGSSRADLSPGGRLARPAARTESRAAGAIGRLVVRPCAGIGIRVLQPSASSLSLGSSHGSVGPGAPAGAAASAHPAAHQGTPPVSPRRARSGLTAGLVSGLQRSGGAERGGAQGGSPRPPAKVDIAAFDVRQAHASIACDEERLLGVIEAGFGSLEGFSARLRSVLTDVREMQVAAAARAAERAERAERASRQLAAAGLDEEQLGALVAPALGRITSMRRSPRPSGASSRRASAAVTESGSEPASRRSSAVSVLSRVGTGSTALSAVSRHGSGTPTRHNSGSPPLGGRRGSPGPAPSPPPRRRSVERPAAAEAAVGARSPRGSASCVCSSRSATTTASATPPRDDGSPAPVRAGSLPSAAVPDAPDGAPRARLNGSAPELSLSAPPPHQHRGSAGKQPAALPEHSELAPVELLGAHMYSHVSHDERIDADD